MAAVLFANLLLRQLSLQDVGGERAGQFFWIATLTRQNSIAGALMAATQGVVGRPHRAPTNAPPTPSLRRRCGVRPTANVLRRRGRRNWCFWHKGPGVKIITFRLVVLCSFHTPGFFRGTVLLYPNNSTCTHWTYARTLFVQPSADVWGNNGHRYDSIPIVNGMINAGMSCQLIHYTHEEHDKFLGFWLDPLILEMHRWMPTCFGSCVVKIYRV